MKRLRRYLVLKHELLRFWLRRWLLVERDLLVSQTGRQSDMLQVAQAFTDGNARDEQAAAGVTRYIQTLEGRIKQLELRLKFYTENSAVLRLAEDKRRRLEKLAISRQA